MQFDTWGVTTDDVLDLTGATVSAGNIRMAAGIVDLYTNRTQAASGTLTPRDFGWIQRAVAYQSAWVAGQLDLPHRRQTAELVQDGMRTRNSDGTGSWREWTVTLGPLAARAIKNLSWKTRRQEATGHRLRVFQRTVDNDPDFILEDGLWS
jgi:hypothetical protein